MRREVDVERRGVCGNDVGDRLGTQGGVDGETDPYRNRWRIANLSERRPSAGFAPKAASGFVDVRGKGGSDSECSASSPNTIS